MARVVEVAPGITAVGQELAVCPGCGCRAAGLNPANRNHVLDWCIGAFAVLADMGVKAATPLAARAVAAAYTKESWCGK